MSGLEVGIVGLPNTGKSTLFNALATRRLAETAPRPFTTIDPHEAVVPVPDRDLEKLSVLVKPKETVPATVTFIDIAGLVKGAHKGEGLGNQFLAKIREVDVIAHVVRVFKDKNVPHVHNKIDPKEDIEIVNLELKLGGIEKKPTIYILNVDESQLGKKLDIPGIAISAKLEEELMDLDEKERKEYLDELGIKESGLEKLIKKSYELLGLITFYTIKGGEEVHAWSIKKGSSALEAAEKVHTDFAKTFIKAEVIGVDKLLEMSNWKEAKEKGKVRLEGKDYIVQERDVIEFKVGV
jgi:small GTP-binding protein